MHETSACADDAVCMTRTLLQIYQTSDIFTQLLIYRTTFTVSVTYDQTQASPKAMALYLIENAEYTNIYNISLCY